jgi:DivIVA domain-containing protein
MDSSQPAQSILETLRTVEFRLGLKGYNVDEVDEYLEKAAVEAEAMQEQARQASERLRQAGERIAQLEGERRNAPAPVTPAAADAGVGDEALQRTLLLAQKFVDQAKRESEAEAAEVVAQAEARARAALAQAEDQARQISTESERRLREEVTRLEGMRGQLAADVENMARHLEAERNRLRTSLADVLKWVDDNIQPANALMALRPRGDGAPSGGDQPRPADATARPAQPRQPRGPQAQPQAQAQPQPQPQAQVPGAGDQASHGGKAPDTVAQVLDLRGAAATEPAPGERS